MAGHDPNEGTLAATGRRDGVRAGLEASRRRALRAEQVCHAATIRRTPCRLRRSRRVRSIETACCPARQRRPAMLIVTRQGRNPPGVRSERSEDRAAVPQGGGKASVIPDIYLYCVGLTGFWNDG